MPTDATFLLAGLLILPFALGFVYKIYADRDRDPPRISADYIRGLNLVLNRRTDEALEVDWDPATVGSVADELLRPDRWGSLTSGISRGVESVLGVRVPYRGLDEWTRTVIPLGGTVLVSAAAIVAFWPRRNRLGFPGLALTLLVALYAVPAVSLNFENEFMRGAALALLVLAFLRLEKLRVGDAGNAGLVAAGVAVLALMLAPALDRDTPWWDYESWALGAASARTTAFTWDHDYGPLDWPRDGRELLRVRASKRPAYWKAANLDAYKAQLAEMMVGREVQLVVDRGESNPAGPVLEVTDLQARDDRGHETVRGVTFDVRAGEIFGIAGVAGNGQDELVDAITGLRRPASGTITLGDQDITNSEPRALHQLDVGFVPADRHRYGMVLSFPLTDNLVLNEYYVPPFARGPVRDDGAVLDDEVRLGRLEVVGGYIINVWLEDEHLRAPEEPFILFVGAFRRVKGVPELLAAYERLENAPPLVMVGIKTPDTPDRFPAGITVLESVPHATVMALWERALFGVFPSTWPEPLATVVHEAMSRGRPVIATRAGGIPEVVIDGQTGLLVPPRDPNGRSSLTRSFWSRNCETYGPFTLPSPTNTCPRNRFCGVTGRGN